jgi:hypothetical protein
MPVLWFILGSLPFRIPARTPIIPTKISTVFRSLSQKYSRHYLTLRLRRLRWSSGYRAGLWYPSLRVQTRPKPLDFSVVKILSMPSFGVEVKASVPCPSFAAGVSRAVWRAAPLEMNEGTNWGLEHNRPLRPQCCRPHTGTLTLTLRL